MSAKQTGWQEFADANWAAAHGAFALGGLGRSLWWLGERDAGIDACSRSRARSPSHGPADRGAGHRGSPYSDPYLAPRSRANSGSCRAAATTAGATTRSLPTLLPPDRPRGRFSTASPNRRRIWPLQIASRADRSTPRPVPSRGRRNDAQVTLKALLRAPSQMRATKSPGCP